MRQRALAWAALVLVALSMATAGGLRAQPTPVASTRTPSASFVRSADIYVRGGPGERFTPVGQLLAGARVSPLSRSEDGAWVLISYYRGYGWIRRDLAEWNVDVDALPTLDESDLTPTANPSVPTLIPFLFTNTPQGNWVDVLPQGAFLRSGPGVQYSVVGSALNGQLVTPVGRDGSAAWILIRTEVGFAWVARDLVRWAQPLLALPVLRSDALTPSATFTASDTPTHTLTATRTLTPTQTRTPSTTSTPTSTHTATSTPTATLTASLTASSMPTTPALSVTQRPTTPAPSATPQPTTPAPSATSRPTTPAPSATPQPTTPAPSATPQPTTPAPSATPQPMTPAPSATPQPTTPAPSATPRPTTPAPSMTPTVVRTDITGSAAGGAAPLPSLAPAASLAPTPAATAEAERGLPTELTIGLLVLVGVLAYVLLYWRAASRADRYARGFVIERCPVCERGTLTAEARQTRTFGIPRVSFTVRCSECRSVLREIGEARWRYAVDPLDNPEMYERLNNRVLSEEQLRGLVAARRAGLGARGHVSRPGTPDEPAR